MSIYNMTGTFRCYTKLEEPVSNFGVTVELSIKEKFVHNYICTLIVLSVFFHDGVEDFAPIVYSAWKLVVYSVAGSFQFFAFTFDEFFVFVMFQIGDDGVFYLNVIRDDELCER